MRTSFFFMIVVCGLTNNDDIIEGTFFGLYILSVKQLIVVPGRPLLTLLPLTT